MGVTETQTEKEEEYEGEELVVPDEVPDKIDEQSRSCETLQQHPHPRREQGILVALQTYLVRHMLGTL